MKVFRQLNFMQLLVVVLSSNKQNKAFHYGLNNSIMDKLNCLILMALKICLLVK